MIFGISTLEFVEMLKNVQNKKKSNLGPKMPDLGILSYKFEKSIIIFGISIFEFFKMLKLKILNFGTKNTGFSCF